MFGNNKNPPDILLLKSAQSVVYEFMKNLEN